MVKGRAQIGPDQLSQLLRAVRGDLSQTAAARRATALLPEGRSLNASKLSRAEGGRYPLAPDEADAVARACRAPTDQRKRLVALAREFASATITSRAALMRNGVEIQRRVASLEAASTLIRAWQDSIVLGMLQTPAYRAGMLGIDPGPEWLRMQETRARQFHEPEREWRLLMSEGALRWPLVSYGVMAEQMRWLVDVSRWQHVRLGVIDQRSVKTFPAPAGGSFHIYGSRTVVNATEAGTPFLNDVNDVRRHEVLFAELEGIALFDDDVRALLIALASHYEQGQKRHEQ